MSIGDIPPGVSAAFFAAMSWLESRPAGSGRPTFAQAAKELETWWEESPLGAAVATQPIKFTVDEQKIDDLMVKLKVEHGDVDRKTLRQGVKVESFGNRHARGAGPSQVVANGHRFDKPQLPAYDRVGWVSHRSSAGSVSDCRPASTKAVMQVRDNVMLNPGDGHAEVWTKQKIRPGGYDADKVVVKFGERELTGVPAAELTVHSYRCSTRGCPERPPQPATDAAGPPVCYTCGAKMRVIL